MGMKKLTELEAAKLKLLTKSRLESRELLGELRLHLELASSKSYRIEIYSSIYQLLQHIESVDYQINELLGEPHL